jgi:hypothetical protein
MAAGLGTRQERWESLLRLLGHGYAELYSETFDLRTFLLMNNRQSGRRRGRGGQRPQGNGGNPNSGNRIDNRARGNAPQLLEKYKNMARDAQMQGDRVLTEYYLQFADHYFRVVSENRARYEENRPRRDEWQGDDGDLPEGQEGEMASEASDGEDGREQRNQRRERRPRQNFRRDEDGDRGEAREDEIEGVGTGALPVDILPPAIGLAERAPVVPSNDVDTDEEDEAPRPRRRGRISTRSAAAEDTAEA